MQIIDQKRKLNRVYVFGYEIIWQYRRIFIKKLIFENLIIIEIENRYNAKIKTQIILIFLIRILKLVR